LLGRKKGEKAGHAPLEGRKDKDSKSMSLVVGKEGGPEALLALTSFTQIKV